VNIDALRVLENQRQEVNRELQNAISTRSTLHWELERNRRIITKNQALLRANKIARKVVQEEQ